jgi:hypothetical protein
MGNASTSAYATMQACEGCGHAFNAAHPATRCARCERVQCRKCHGASGCVQGDLPSPLPSWATPSPLRVCVCVGGAPSPTAVYSRPTLTQ